MTNNSIEMPNCLEQIYQRCGEPEAEVAIILGSGLGHLREHLRNFKSIFYSDLPVFPLLNKVEGHQAELLIGELFGKKVALFCGRFHVYQGLSAFEATAPVRLAAALGCRSILLTCAVGGIAENINAGDFFLVNDHLNFSGHNPLQGINPSPFIDLHNCYRHEFYESLLLESRRLKLALHAGVLAYMVGPSYETPAEIRALRTLGASVVGMSAVPEAIMARALGLQVATLALVTNIAMGSVQVELSHKDVLTCSAEAAEPFRCLVKTLLPNLISNKSPF